MSSVEIYDGESLLDQVDLELDREYMHKEDFVSEKELEKVLKNIRRYFEFLSSNELESLNNALKLLYGDLELDQNDLPVMIFIFNKDGDQIDFYSGYSDFFTGTSQENFLIYL